MFGSILIETSFIAKHLSVYKLFHRQTHQDCLYYIILLVIHLVHEWNIVIFPEFNELKLVFHEAQPSGIQDFNELNEGNMIIFHEWTK